MTMTDPIADMLTRIRNANTAYKDDVLVPASTMKVRLAEILQREGYVELAELEGEGTKRAVHIRLKYGPGRERTITGIRRISKPGKRVYVGQQDIPRVLGGLGIAILSTSKGLLTDRQARLQGLGGEVVAYVW